MRNNSIGIFNHEPTENKSAAKSVEVIEERASEEDECTSFKKRHRWE